MLAEKQHVDLSHRKPSFLLEQWVLWYKTNKAVRLGYPTRAAFANSIAENRETPAITDEQAMIIDDVIARMRSSEKMKKSTDVLIDYYDQGSYVAAEKIHKLSRASVRNMVLEAENRFAGLLGICD